MKLVFYTHRYDGPPEGPCIAQGVVAEPRPDRPGHRNEDGVRVADAPCGLPRIAHEQGPLAHHTSKPRVVQISEADLERWRRPMFGADPARWRTASDAERARSQQRTPGGGRGGPDGGPGAADRAGRRRGRRARDQAGNPPGDGSDAADIRVLVPNTFLSRLAARGAAVDVVGTHPHLVVRTRGDRPWPLLHAEERQALVLLAQTRDALRLLRTHPSQRARVSGARRAVAERLAVSLGRAAATDDLALRERIMADAMHAAVIRLERAERLPTGHGPRQPRQRPPGQRPAKPVAVAPPGRRP
ncbi:MAG: hypothetical protein ACP5VP_02940 [Candidatus Limnocylindrales bacterium]